MRRHNRDKLALHFAERELAKRKPGDPLYEYYQGTVERLRAKLGDGVECKRCHQWLTDPVAVERQLGPDCYRIIQDLERRAAAKA